MTDKEADLQTLRQARPWLRSAVALLVWLHIIGEGEAYKDEAFDTAYSVADAFVTRLEQDVSSNSAA